MEFLKEWTFCVCVSLSVAVLLSMFAPKGKMNGFYKMLISLFIFISFIYPLKDYHMRDINIPEITVPFENNQPYAAMAENEIKKLLEENGIIGANVSCEVSSDYASGEIELKSAQVSIPDEYSADEVYRLIFDRLGINARVIYNGQ